MHYLYLVGFKDPVMVKIVRVTYDTKDRPVMLVSDSGAYYNWTNVIMMTKKKDA